MATEVFVTDEDLFSREAVRNARAVDDRVARDGSCREAGRARTSRMLARYEHVSKGLRTGRLFPRLRGRWHDPNSVRPEILLTDDPPRHTAGPFGHRDGALAEGSEQDGRCVSRGCAGARDSREAEERRDYRCGGGYPRSRLSTRLLPDLLGVPVKGREHMYAFGNMVWATMGPMNDLFQEAMSGTASEVLEWANMCCERRTSRPIAWGWRCISPRIEGELTQAEAKLRWGFCCLRLPIPLC